MYSIMFESMSDACSCLTSSPAGLDGAAVTEGDALAYESSDDYSVLELPPISKLLHVFVFFYLVCD